MISIITPSYNSEQFIAETIESVISQSYQDWEMIIVDDFSTDNSIEIVKRYQQVDDRIRLIALDQNVGAAMARNRALEVAKGRYIAFLDSDDLWLPNKLERQLSFMIDRDYAFTFMSYTPISEDGKLEYKVIKAPSKLNYNSYCKNTIIGCLTVMIDRQRTGDFKMVDIRSSHDMALWLDILKRGYDAYGLDENLAKYRVVSNSNTSKKFIAAKEVWDVYTKVERLPFLRSSWYFINYTLNAIKKRF